MSFQAFAQSHGLIIPEIIPDGRWHRVRTEDHPRKKNGAYLYDGSRGVVKNWAADTGFETWKEEQQRHNVGRKVVKDIARSLRDERERHARARIEAAKLLSECEQATHPYLTAKGFPEAKGLIHASGDLMIPMRDCQDYGAINSVQRIKPDGSKLFIPGGKAKGSVFVIGRGARGERFLVEGYATGLSVQAALIELRKRCEVWVCFSDSNLVHVAQFVRRPAFVVADNDRSFAGLKAAKLTELPFVIPETVGEDFNDLHQRAGLRSAVELLLTLGR